MATQMVRHSAVDLAAVGGIRVILCDPDSTRRAQLREFIDNDPVLIVAAEACDWGECLAGLADVVPELLIAPADLIPAQWTAASDPHDFFPVVVALQGAMRFPGSPQSHKVLPFPVDGQSIKRFLDQVVADIYGRKAKQLRYLVDRYVASANLPPPRRTLTIRVERSGQVAELKAEEIVSIVAARKWVSVHTMIGHFVAREPLHLLAEKLNPSMFIRIHRSVIINRSFLDTDITNSARLSSVLMADGSRRPVGPSYREALSQAIKDELESRALEERKIS